MRDLGERLDPATFAIDGKQLEIDLEFEAWAKSARRIGAATRRPARTSRGGRADLNTVREWASQNGHQVSDRGRVPASILEAYDAAH